MGEERAQLEANKAAVRLFLESVGRHDLDGIRNALAENVVQHYAAPSNQTDDGKHDSAAISSREAILEEIGTHFHGTLYRKRSEEHTSELQSLMRHSYAVFCL